MKRPALDAVLAKKMSRKEFLLFGALGVGIITGITGLIRELASHASTPASSTEPETGTPANGAGVVSDTTASGSHAVKFGAGIVGGMLKVFEDQFASLATSSWKVYDNSNFGAPNRIQLYKSANAVFGTGSADATNGTSVKLLSKREVVTYGGKNYNFTSGMLDTQSVGHYFPRYGRIEFRCKVPHGQGLWPCIWLTAKNGGATMAELDIMEYFHAQLPGKNSTTLHGTQNDGTFKTNRYTNNQNRTFFEHPTYTPAWHTWAQDIVPVTDASGSTHASPTAPSSFVKYTTYLDGTAVYTFVDTSAQYYTTNGGSEDSFWQLYMQGCQIDGPYIGGVDDPLGYSHELNTCLISGTAPNNCATTRDNVNYVQAAHFGDPSSVVEVDYVKFYKYTP